MRSYSIEAVIKATEDGSVKWNQDGEWKTGADRSVTTIINQGLVTLTRNGSSRRVMMDSKSESSFDLRDTSAKPQGNTLLDRLWNAACKSAAVNPDD